MANYRSIHVKFWNDGTIEGLSPNSKLLMLYFLTNPYRNESGLYSITLKRMGDDTGLTAKQRDRALDELREKGRVFYDENESVVWVVNAIRHASLNENCKKSVRYDIEFSSSRALVESLLFYYKSIGYLWVYEGFVAPDNPTYRVQGIGNRDRVQGIGKGEEHERGGKGRRVFVPPKVEEVIAYFAQAGFSEALARRAFEHYALADWHDARGEPVLSWKQKMHSVWLTDKNRNGGTNISTSGARRSPAGSHGTNAKPGKYARIAQQTPRAGGEGEPGTARDPDEGAPKVSGKGP